ncbi:MAG: CHASE2 domain-containing protein [Dysgonamonadaceae bacterium]|jgi:CHASE2 domain-containing sensor protein|nr:CHASE2 domain-containing protein [Dysgonamonadaceae bacterium]
MKLLLKTGFRQASGTVRRWTGFAVISLMTLGLVQLTILFPLSIERFNVAQNIFEQYNLVDTYFTIHGNTKDTTNYTDDIVIVDVAGVNDCDILAKYIEMIGSASPKVIGFDIHFDKLCDCSDTNLVRVLSATSNLVTINYLTDSIQWNKFRKKQDFFSECYTPVNSGFSNLVEDKGFSSTYRKFTDYMFLNRDTVRSFASVIAQIAMPDKYKALIHRKFDTEFIDYTNYGFEKIFATNTDTLSKQLYKLENQIVLIGDLEDYKDKLATPINPQMSGVEIHAYILATIQNGNYIYQMPEPVTWILAFFIIMLMASLKYWIANKNEWLSLFMPVFQLIIILSGIFVDYWLFIEFHYYIPVIRILIGMAILGFPYDLYYKILKTTRNYKKQ